MCSIVDSGDPSYFVDCREFVKSFDSVNKVPIVCIWYENKHSIATVNILLTGIADNQFYAMVNTLFGWWYRRVVSTIVVNTVA